MNILRNKDQRQKEIRPIIMKLRELHLNPSQDEIKELYERMKTYINIGESVEINIPITSLNVRIIGILEGNLNKKSCVKIECLTKFNEESEED